MECFTHNSAVAVGVCKTCGKAICRTCAIDSGMFVTCSDSCAKEAIDLHEMNQRGKKNLRHRCSPKNAERGNHVVALWCVIWWLWYISKLSLSRTGMVPSALWRPFFLHCISCVPPHQRSRASVLVPALLLTSRSADRQKATLLAIG